MTYSALESSIQDGKPIYKFLFVNGVDEYRYTSAAYFISDSDQTWTPAAIRASSVEQTNELAKNGVKITLPRTNDVAKLFLGKVPEVTTSVTIYRTHDGLDTDQVWWKGRVAAVETGEDAVTLECEDIFTSMRRPGLRARYQKGCRHALYSPSCGVQMYEYAREVEIIEQNDFTLKVTGLADSAGDSTLDSNEPNWLGDYYVGGIIELTDGSMRHIIGQTLNVLTLMSPFDAIDIDSVGMMAIIYPGCPHTIVACREKFDNILNYGGFPYIPAKNPFQNSVTGSIA